MMATLALDTPRNHEVNEDQIFNDIPVAVDIIYQGAVVGLNSSGYARPLVAGDPFLGFCDRQADNSAGSAGDTNVRVRQKGSVQLTVVGASAVTDVGQPVYASDDNVFTLTGGANTLIGIITRWVTSTTCVVRFEAKSVANKPIRNVQAHTASDTLTVEEAGNKVHTNTGAAGAITLTLPPATVGLEYHFAVGAAQELRIDADGTETLGTPSTATVPATGVQGTGGKYLTANAIGESLWLICAVAGAWTVMSSAGTWGFEA